jgi:hypothetical protein
MTGNGESNGHSEIQKILLDGAVLKAAHLGRQRALRVHKALGNPIVRNIDGKVILVPPDQIELEEPPPPLFSRQGLE